MQQFYRHLLLPAYEGGLKGRRVFPYWRMLERSQWRTRAQLELVQFEALRRLIGHAFENCPYYRETWLKHGLDARALRSPEDFRRWPVTDRQAIRANRLRMRSKAPGLKLIAKSTGGSTGVPLHFDLNADSNERRMAAWHRGYAWAGAEPGTKQLYLWGTKTQVSRLLQWKDQLYSRLYRRLVLSAFDLSEQRVPQFLQQLNRYRPQVIVGYTGALCSFASALEEQGLKPFSPKAIVIGAEKLHPFQRQLLERVFAAPVFETYGSREFMLIAAECDRHQGLHLTTETLLVEVLDDDGKPTPDGEEGNVVITDLYNYGMPFVRYANGDRAVAGWGECSCGRGLPLLRTVIGRRADVLSTPDGRRISGLFFPHLFKDFSAVKRFQVVQNSLDDVEVRLVVNPRWSQRDRSSVQSAIRTALGPGVRVNLVLTSDIPLTPAGKLQVVVNKSYAPAANH